jgi:deazaflavin-dependent oxidoreductase (nitroreductase family)
MSTTRFYKRPTAFRRRVYDPLMKALIQRVGFSGVLDRRGHDTVQVLSVRGRKTGRLYQHPVGVSVHNGHRYVVGFYGQTEWALNLRAGTEAALSTRGSEQPIRAVELAGDEKAEFMRFLVGRYRFFARAWLKVDPRRMSDADLARLLRDHPVFRVEDIDPH